MSNALILDPLEMAQNLLSSVKKGEAYGEHLDRLKGMERRSLQQALSSDQQKLAFWLNVYNALTQLKLNENERIYAKRRSFYAQSRIEVAQEFYSLEEIEHRILRKNQAKYGFGYVKSWKRSTKFSSLEPKKRDPRIHFALNCGAKSCPPIHFYGEAGLDDELDLACLSYLEQSCYVAQGKLYIPAVFKWFRGDFGGQSGIYVFLRKFDVLGAQKKLPLKYLPYDWTLDRANYR